MTQEQQKNASKLEKIRTDLWSLVDLLNKSGYKASDYELHLLDNIKALVTACDSLARHKQHKPKGARLTISPQQVKKGSKMKNKKNDEKLQALKQLKKTMLKVKDKRVYAMVTHVSSSGLSRDITFRVITNNGDLLRIDPYIKKILGCRWANNFRGLHICGCGMDMIFNTLYNVNSVALYYGIIKKSKNKDSRDLQYKGLVNSSYYSL